MPTSFLPMKNDYFWSLTIEPGWTQAAIWTIADQTTTVLAMGPATRWETDAELIGAVDASLSSCVASLPDESIEPSKTVFGVPPSWVSEGQIKREHLDKMREICSKLSLEPTGFVVLSEAIAHFVKSEEGTPLNGVVIGVGETFLDISVFRLGNLMGIVNVGRSVSVIDDVVEGLARFGHQGDALPSRFLLYNGKSAELEEARQALVQADWTGELKDKLTFLHTPSVEIVDPQEKVVAVSLAGASEMGEVKKVLFERRGEEKSEPDTEEQESEEFTRAQDAQGLVQHMTPQDVGFALDHDVAEDVHAESDEREPDESDDNIRGTSDMAPLHRTIPKRGFSFAPILSKMKYNLKKATGFISSSPVASVHRHHPTPHLPTQAIHHAGRRNPFEKVPFTLGVGVFAILAIVGFALWWFIPKAQVTIYVSPRQLEETQQITVDPGVSSIDISNRVIPGTLKEITVTGDKTASTTGSKVVGEKAKGKVQIRNGTAVSIKVNSGTTLFGPNDLKFVTDSSASVSAALSPSTPGTETVDVTAEKIGSDYNLAKGETFKVGNYPKSEVDGVVDGDLSGGSSREITAVSADDLKNLESELTDELIDQGRSQIAGELGVDEIFVAESIKSEVVSKTYSNKVGDEAANIRLSLELKLTGLVISRVDANELAKLVLSGEVPSGFTLRDDQITSQFSAKGESSGNVWQFDTTFGANLLPEVKPDEVARKISGKYPIVAQEYLSTIPGFVRAQIRLSPGFLPAKLAVLPRVVGNIDIEIAAEQ